MVAYLHYSTALDLARDLAFEEGLVPPSLYFTCGHLDAPEADGSLGTRVIDKHLPISFACEETEINLSPMLYAAAFSICSCPKTLLILKLTYRLCYRNSGSLRGLLAGCFFTSASSSPSDRRLMRSSGLKSTLIGLAANSSAAIYALASAALSKFSAWVSITFKSGSW